MSVDVFGRALSDTTNSYSRGPPGLGFELTNDGQLDAKEKRLSNLSDPVSDSDAVTLQSLKKETEKLLSFTKSELSSIQKIIVGVQKEHTKLKNLTTQFKDDIIKRLNKPIPNRTILDRVEK